jgi:hypothetical protein
MDGSNRVLRVKTTQRTDQKLCAQYTRMAFTHAKLLSRWHAWLHVKHGHVLARVVKRVRMKAERQSRSAAQGQPLMVICRQMHGIELLISSGMTTCNALPARQQLAPAKLRRSGTKAGNQLRLKHATPKGLVTSTGKKVKCIDLAYFPDSLLSFVPSLTMAGLSTLLIPFEMPARLFPKDILNHSAFVY